MKLKTKLLGLLLLLSGGVVSAQSLSALHVEGPFLVNAEGKRVNLHGFAQTFSGCLDYNKGIIDGILNAGWKMTFVRQHMDPYWSNTPGASSTYGDSWKGEADIRAFDFNRFKKYLDEVFVPMAEYAIAKGLYVVMRPPGVCPEYISVGGEYHEYLKKVWGYVAQHPKLKNNGAILFELANEPINIKGTRERDIEMTDFMQQIVDIMRDKGCNNILLIPGLTWQQHYNGFVKYPIKGENIGYAVHCYPGWYNSGVEDNVEVEYKEFKRGWDENILPIATKAPVVVTEMDWAPKKYNASWGKAVTGVAGGKGFGANFMRIADETCNVSWLLFTGGELLAKYNDAAPDGNTFLTDPEACPRPVYRKYLYYATQEYSDLINQPDHVPTIKEQPLFSLTEEWLNPSIWEKGTFDEATGKLVTGKYGFGGWQYPNGVDLSAYKYLVVSFGSETKIVLDLHNLKAYKDDACTQFDHDINPSHIYIAGFWTYGGTPVYIKDIFLSNDGVNPTGVSHVALSDEVVSREYYTLTGAKIVTPIRGICIIKEVTRSGSCYK